jgi:hypothetical protein
VIAEYAMKAGRDGVGKVLAFLDARVCGFDMAAAISYGELSKQHTDIFNVSVPEKERMIIDLMLVAIADNMGIESVISSDKHLCGRFLSGTSQKIQGLDIKKSIAEMYPLWSSDQN